MYFCGLFFCAMYFCAMSFRAEQGLLRLILSLRLWRRMHLHRIAMHVITFVFIIIMEIIMVIIVFVCRSSWSSSSPWQSSWSTLLKCTNRRLSTRTLGSSTNTCPTVWNFKALCSYYGKLTFHQYVKISTTKARQLWVFGNWVICKMYMDLMKNCLSWVKYELIYW